MKNHMQTSTILPNLFIKTIVWQNGNKNALLIVATSSTRVVHVWYGSIYNIA